MTEIKDKLIAPLAFFQGQTVGKQGKRFTFCTLLVGGPAPNPL